MQNTIPFTNQSLPEREPLAVLPSRWTCGCIPEARLCPEALQLWAAASAAFTQSITEDDFRDYQNACQAFDAHYALQVPAPVGLAAETRTLPR